MCMCVRVRVYVCVCVCVCVSVWSDLQSIQPAGMAVHALGVYSCVAVWLVCLPVLM